MKAIARAMSQIAALKNKTSGSTASSHSSSGFRGIGASVKGITSRGTKVRHNMSGMMGRQSAVSRTAKNIKNNIFGS